MKWCALHLTTYSEKGEEIAFLHLLHQWFHDARKSSLELLTSAGWRTFRTTGRQLERLAKNKSRFNLLSIKAEGSSYLRNVFGDFPARATLVLSPCSTLWDYNDERTEARGGVQTLDTITSQGRLDDFSSVKTLIQMQRLPIKEPTVLSIVCGASADVNRDSFARCLEQCLRHMEAAAGVPSDIRVYATVSETPYFDGGMNVVLDTRSFCADRSRWRGRFLQPRMILASPGTTCQTIADRVAGASATRMDVKTTTGEFITLCQLPESSLQSETQLRQVRDYFAVIVARGESEREHQE